MSSAVLATAFALVALVCAIRVLIHAFGRSVGTGVIVLLVPAYLPVYAFNQFEHTRKGWIVAGMLAFSVLAAVFGAMALQQSVPPLPPGASPIG